MTLTAEYASAALIDGGEGEGDAAAVAVERLRETARERKHMRAAPHRSPLHMREARTGPARACAARACQAGPASRLPGACLPAARQGGP